MYFHVHTRIRMYVHKYYAYVHVYIHTITCMYVRTQKSSEKCAHSIVNITEQI